VDSTFPRTRKPQRGYHAEQVDEFLQVARRAYDGVPLASDPPLNSERIRLTAFALQKGGYVTADVINVNANTPGLDAMLNRFNKEHFHDEDEVRFIVHGRGLFHFQPADGEVFSLEMVKGDMIRVPRGTQHWFDLCQDRTIRAIRLFQDMSGWTPHYTGSGADEKFQPLCFGPGYIPATGGL
jgi:DivIVA domain-containing protein